MNGEEIRRKRLLARIPGHALSKRASIGRGRLSDIEAGHVTPKQDEVDRIEAALDQLIHARRKIARLAAEVGWPLPPAA